MLTEKEMDENMKKHWNEIALFLAMGFVLMFISGLAFGSFLDTSSLVSETLSVLVMKAPADVWDNTSAALMLNNLQIKQAALADMLLQIWAITGMVAVATLGIGIYLVTTGINLMLNGKPNPRDVALDEIRAMIKEMKK